MVTNLAPATSPEVAQAAIEQAKAKKKPVRTPTHRVREKAREAVDRLFDLIPQTHDAKIGKIDLYVTPAQEDQRGNEVIGLEVFAKAKVTMTLGVGTGDPRPSRSRY